MFNVSQEEEECARMQATKKAAEGLMTVSLRERVKLYECAINKSPPSN